MMIRILLIPVAVVIASCGSPRSEGDRGDAEQSPDLAQITHVPPNHCRVMGTIVSIDNAMATSGDDPCSKGPCYANVRIDSVLGYGSAFPHPLATGNVVRVKFAYTLSPTKEIYPEMDPGFPGLRVGSTLRADMRSEGEMGPGETAKGRYIIYAYEAL
jgi:hypothetical protein